MREANVKIVMHLGSGSSKYILGPLAPLELGRYVPHPPPVYVLDRAVADHHATWLEQMQAACDAQDAPVLILPGGEQVKSFARLEAIVEWLAEMSVARDRTLVAVGGGAVLDIAGLAAAIWRRGLGFVAIPTTLLAMVDAAIGGKTALNAAGLKNPVGCFHPAAGILADPGFLATLPRAEWRNGMAELVKTAVIGDPELFARLHAARPRLDNLLAGGDGQDPVPGILGGVDWKDWIGRAAKVKARIVQRDFREQGMRRCLNLGHTLGHALEALSQVEPAPLSHGQAVAIGMAVVFRIAAERNICRLEDAVRTIEILEACGLPTRCPAPDHETLDRALLGDKKHLSRGGLYWVLPRGIGRMDIHGQIATAELLKWLD
ncbi:3-dehydroquinate synthase [bacterium CG_4_9_14_3_um_filter_65_15]|nr:MAG: 3-dehydroquinate synthase [bacterium CG_4_9_14_3_um_filter_65_15]